METVAVPISQARVPSVVTYSRKDIDDCMQKITPIAFNEAIELPPGIHFVALSSGYCIGGCNWLIQGQLEKIAIVTSSASATDRHPEAINIDDLENCDVLVMYDMNSSTNTTPDGMLADLGNQVVQTLEANGRVLVATQSCGLAFDIIECIVNFLQPAGYQHIPIIFISPVAQEALDCANRSLEWLCSGRQKRRPHPFVHSTLPPTHRLHVHSSLNQDVAPLLESPCVVIWGDPFLRNGQSSMIVNAWGQDPNSRIILTHPEVSEAEILQPYTDLKAGVLYFPLDVRLTRAEANQLIARCHPRHLMIPHEALATTIESDTHLEKVLPLDAVFGRKVKAEEDDYGTSSIMLNQNVSVPSKTEFISGSIGPQVAHQVKLSSIGKMTGSSMSCKVKVNRINGEFELESNLLRERRTHLLGRLHYHDMLGALEKKGGYDDMEVNDYKAYLPSLQMRIDSRMHDTILQISDESALEPIRSGLYKRLFEF